MAGVKHGIAVDWFRVLHFISNSYPSGYFPLIARHTDRARFEMTVASLDHRGGLQEQLEEVGVPSFALGADRRADYPAATVRLARWLRGHHIDVIHTHLFDAALVGLAAARLARTPVAIFTGHHSHEVPLYHRRLLLEVDRFAATRLADVVIAPSKEMAETFVNLYRCRAEKVEVIEHGIDLDRFDPKQYDRRAARSELGLEGKLVFGAISKHHWVKNLEPMVRAFVQIVERERSAHLVVLGIGDSSALAALVGKLGLSEQVTIMTPRPDVAPILAALDVFVHPALAESFGLAVVEAMAMRLPVVATPVGIARDIVENGISGFVIEGTDLDSIAGALLWALECRELWPALGAEARSRALAFTPERWVQAHERLYERWLAGSAQT